VARHWGDFSQNFPPFLFPPKFPPISGANHRPPPPLSERRPSTTSTLSRFSLCFLSRCRPTDRHPSEHRPADQERRPPYSLSMISLSLSLSTAGHSRFLLCFFFSLSGRSLLVNVVKFFFSFCCLRSGRFQTGNFFKLAFYYYLFFSAI
jgi:hypothetical protein